MKDNSIDNELHEFCPRCEANLTLQNGYSNELPYWICKGCGEMLINPTVPGDIVWICDGCGALLNVQEDGGSKFIEYIDGKNNTDIDSHATWTCTECGYVNGIDNRDIYLTEDEYLQTVNSPYYGLSDDDMLILSEYREEGVIDGRSDIILVRDTENDKLYVKKLLSTYDIEVYRNLMKHPIKNMPLIHAIFEGANSLVVIEEYIEGRCLSDIMLDGPLAKQEALKIALSVALTVERLHGLNPPIIHRDIKPSNIIINPHGEAILLDVNVAKLYNEEQNEDTRLLGTRYYAAPEQLGFGFHASDERTDVYAIGMLLNVMLTGHLPKEKRADEPMWSVISRCIRLDPEDRPTTEELIAALAPNGD